MSGCRSRTDADHRRPELGRRRRPAGSPQVCANTSVIISMAMSQRMPSHWSAMADQRLDGRVPQGRGQNALSCTTSGQGGKYGSRPGRAPGRRPRRRRPAAGPGRPSRALDEDLRLLAHPGMVGGDVVRHVVEHQPRPRARPVRPGPRPARPDRRARRRRRSAGRSTASR